MKVLRKNWPAFLAVTATKVILVDGTGQYTLYTSDEKLYGLTWYRKHIYVSTRHFPHEEGRSTILRFDRNMQLVDRLPVKGLGKYVHQLFAWRGRLYICNTDQANLIEYDLSTGAQRSIRWTHENVHLNCLWKHGFVFYALEHRHEHSPKQIVMLDGFTFHVIGRIPVHTPEQTPQTGFGVHDIFILGGKYMTLGPYAVYLVDPSSEPVTTEHSIEGVEAGKCLLRGLAHVPGERFLIGVSTLAPRSARGFGDSYVLLTNTKFDVVGRITLKDVGQVLSLRLLRNDMAHHSIACPYQPDWK